jgi:hypothetical protein
MLRRNSAIGSRVLAVSILLAATARISCAQTNERTYESLEFRVVTPGARAVAMGKTFVGIADDATAAASNPAGLSNLLEPEISIEWTGTNNIQDRIVATTPVATQQFAQFVGYPSFASFVTPLPDKRGIRNVTLAAFYNSTQRFKTQFVVPNFTSAGERIPTGGYYGRMETTASAFGLAGAVLVSPQISIGGAFTLQHLGIGVNSNTSDSGEPDQVHFRSGSVTESSSTRPSGQLGILVKYGWLTLGAAYNAGTTFHTTTTVRGKFTPDRNLTLPSTCTYDARSDTCDFPGVDKQTDYRIPTRLAFGLSFKPTSALTFVADIVDVRYSQLITPNFLIVDWMLQPSGGLNPSLYFVNDAVELHGGAEYRFFRSGRVLAIRGGVFSDPDHQMRFDFGHSAQNGPPMNQEVEFDTYYPGTIVGVTGGGGIVLGNRFQIDAAVSWSANAHELVISSVVRFPR